MTLKVNGADANVDCKPGAWAPITRDWNAGDQIEARIPLPLRLAPVDRQHPKRAAIVRGPVVLAQEANIHEPVYKLPDNDEELNQWLVPDGDEAAVFRHVPPGAGNVMAKFRPFYTFIESFYYRMYFDLDKLPFMWL
jgi:DUF1680 family protein